MQIPQAAITIITHPVFWVTLASAVGAAIPKIYRWYRDQEVKDNFVYDMATNHLPHQYHVLALICDKLGVEVTEPPPIQWIDFNKKK